MPFTAVLVYHAARSARAPSVLRELAAEQRLRILPLSSAHEVLNLASRSQLAGIVLGPGSTGEVLGLCRALKKDSLSAIVPVVVLEPRGEQGFGLEALAAGADEVLTASMRRDEQFLRLQRALQRADRDLGVHPSTRLPGTAQIERDITERLRRKEGFAVCYADLDNFKEFNDRYGYSEGDRVILLLSRMLRDVVRAHAPTGFLGHIGGDDFIFNVPLAQMRVCCEEGIAIFDELIPYQYTEVDRHAGYFLGKDRQGTIFRIPLMSLSIGVVTNESRRFTHPAQVSELATEMKVYAKTLPGSVYAVDRRSEDGVVVLGGRVVADGLATGAAEQP